MNRTKRLMTAVTTSILLAGTAPMLGAYAPAQQQGAPQQDESWKTDPHVQRCGRYHFGRDSRQNRGRSDDAGRYCKAIPHAQSALIGDALKLLVWQAEIKRMGDGSKDNPFKYFEMSGHEG